MSGSVMRVGLTGGIACGKSVVMRELGRLGCHLIDADQIARDVVEPEQPGWQRVVQQFGPEVLLADGQIDRRRLGRIIFSDPSKREKLNHMLHPLILEAEEDRIYWLKKSGFHGLIVVEAALMIEAGSHKNYEKLIVVYCDPTVQLKRLALRDKLTIDEARGRIESQMPLEDKMKHASHLIDTSGSLRSTHEQVRNVYYALLDEFLRREAGGAEPLA